MPPMHRLAASLARGRVQLGSPSSSTTISAARASSRSFSVAAVRQQQHAQGDGTGTDATTASGQPLDGAQKKNYDAAHKSQEQDSRTSEGHSLDRSNHGRKFQDAHTEEVTKASKQRDSGGSKSDLDAVNLANDNAAARKAEKQRSQNSTSSKAGFQPGQKGEQVGGQAASGEPLSKGEGMAGQTKAPSNSTLGGLGQAAKNMAGGGPSNGFHTFTRLRTKSTPDEAVEKGARDSKDKNVKGAQSEHLPHHNAGEGDQMPAVKNSGGLPSKGGKRPSDPPETMSTSSTPEAGATGRDGKKQQTRKYSTNLGKEPRHDSRPVGTSDTPGSRAIDLDKGEHSPSFADSMTPKAAYVHVKGTPEPDSYQTKYAYSTTTDSGAIPSGMAPRSSTSNDAYNKATTGYLAKNEAGIGSSNKTIEDPMNQANEMVDQQVQAAEAGQAGDDAGGRAYAVPPDVGEIEEDTLPKPIKK